MPTAKPVLIEPSRMDLAASGLAVNGSRQDYMARRAEGAPQLGNPVLPTVLVKLLSSAREALTGDDASANQFIARASTLILAEIKLEGAKSHAPTAVVLSTYLAPWQARRAIEFIEANLVCTIKMEELAAVARLGASYFSRAFHADFGMSPYAYVIRRRIKRAQEMMLLTDKPLASIALSCGFADQSHLTRLFHRVVGVSPARWRRLRCSAE
jgi:AraC family transcriptional regulator